MPGLLHGQLKMHGCALESRWQRKRLVKTAELSTVVTRHMACLFSVPLLIFTSLCLDTSCLLPPNRANSYLSFLLSNPSPLPPPGWCRCFLTVLTAICSGIYSTLVSFWITWPVPHQGCNSLEARRRSHLILKPRGLAQCPGHSRDLKNWLNGWMSEFSYFCQHLESLSTYTNPSYPLKVQLGFVLSDNVYSYN